MIDFEKIKQKVAQLSGQKKNNLWWPEVGKDYVVRILPWPDGNNGEPFKERAFYYGIGQGKAIVAPFQFGDVDPVQQLITKLRNEGTPASLDEAKKLYPKKKYFAPVIIRGSEDEGVKLWSLSKETVTDIYNIILDEAGDITDIKEGRDITVRCVISGKKWQGKDVGKISVQPKMSKSVAGKANDVKQWLESTPKLDDIYKKISPEELEKKINDHINGDDASAGLEMKQSSSADEDVVAQNVNDVFSEIDKVTED